MSEKNPGNAIANARSLKGLSQEELAELSGISLRTIQRVESGSVIPRPHTLRSICQPLELEIAQLQQKDAGEEAIELNWNGIRKVNLAALSVLLLPGLQILIQLLIKRKHNLSDKEHKLIKRLISFQVFWLIVSLLAIALTPLISYILSGQTAFGHFPLPQLVYVMLLLCNVIITIINAVKIDQKKENILLSVPRLF
ncbi:MAG: helix-turn-helix transcriptional regulator [Bacteroidota bacterium]